MKFRKKIPSFDGSIRHSSRILTISVYLSNSSEFQLRVSYGFLAPFTYPYFIGLRWSTIICIVKFGLFMHHWYLRTRHFNLQCSTTFRSVAAAINVRGRPQSRIGQKRKRVLSVEGLPVQSSGSLRTQSICHMKTTTFIYKMMYRLYIQPV